MKKFDCLIISIYSSHGYMVFNFYTLWLIKSQPYIDPELRYVKNEQVKIFLSDKFLG